jgi:hypothetical protein
LTAALMAVGGKWRPGLASRPLRNHDALRRESASMGLST